MTMRSLKLISAKPQSAIRIPKLLLLLCSLLLAPCFSAQAQETGKIPRIGFLSTTALSSLSPRLDAFRQGLRAIGYIEGKNIDIEYRSADGKSERLPDLAAELARLKVDCLVTGGKIRRVLPSKPRAQSRLS